MNQPINMPLPVLPYGTERPLQTMNADPSANSVMMHGGGVSVNVNWKTLIVAGIIGAGIFYLFRKKNLTRNRF